MKSKSLLITLLLALIVPWAANAQQVQIGDGTSTSSYLPSYDYYNYSLTQQIFTESEINANGNITSIAFYCKTNAATRSLDIYMVSTAKETFTGTSDWITVTAADLVFSGDVDFTNNAWTTITLDNAFTYSGTGNVAVIVDDNTGDYEYSAATYNVFSATSQAIRVYNDDTNYNPTNPSSYTGSVMSVKNQIILGGIAQAFPAPTGLTASGVAGHIATLNWTENGTATEWVLAYKKSADTDFTELTVNSKPYQLTSLDPETTYNVKVRSKDGSNLSSWSSTINFTTTVPCPAPTGLTASNFTATSATLSWTEPGEASDWVLEYGTASDFTGTTSVNVSGTPSTNLTGLTETVYYARVKADCGGSDGESSWSSTLSFEPTDKTVIGSGTATSSYLPSNTNYNYSYTQQIYTAAELGAAGYIESIDFYMTSTTAITRDMDVYMVYTTKSAFASKTDVIPVTSSDMVFSGDVAFAPNAWTTITLNNGFIYDGTQNVAIIVDDNTGTYTSRYFRAFSATDQAIYFYQDGSDIDPGAPSASNNGMSSSKNQIRLLKGAMPTCFPPTGLTVDDVTNHTAEISWTASGHGETAWHVYYSTSSTAPADDISLSQVTAVTTPTYTFTGLDAETKYYFWVRSNCGTDDYSSWVGSTFTTEIACAAPTALTISNIGSTSATFGWTSDGDDFDVKYAELPAASTEYKYDDGTLSTGFGGCFAAVMFPAGSYTESNIRTISVYDPSYGDGAVCPLWICYGSDTEPDGTVIYEDNITYTGADAFIDIPVGVAVDNSENLWVIIYSSGAGGTYPLAVCDDGGGTATANGRWASDDGTTWEDLSADWGYDNAWMIRVTLDEGGYTWINQSSTTNSYDITGLTAEKDYMAKVRRVCGGIDGESAWTGTFFTTLNSCPTPTDLTASNITRSTAHVAWTGSPDVTDYTVWYRTAAVIDNDALVLNEGFDGSSVPTGWTNGEGTLNSDGTATITSGSKWSFGTNCGVFDSHAYFNMYNTKSYWLITPSQSIGKGYAMTFDAAYTAYSYSSTNSAPVTGGPHKLYVLISTDDKAHWTVLREWNNTGSSFVLDEIPPTGQTIASIDLSAYEDATAYIAILGVSSTSSYDNNIHIDNVKIGGAIAAGTPVEEVTANQYYDLSGLTPAKDYEVKVKSNCTGGVYCEPVSFTTLPPDTKVFIAEGDWATAANWAPAGAPAITDNVIIRANATITSGVATAKKITFEGSTTPTLTINGGQLQTDNAVTATVKKSIKGYITGNESVGDHYYLIANPLNSTLYASEMTTAGLLTPPYDFYSWNYADANEWVNYEEASFNFHTQIGYLYANANNITLSFTGTVPANNTDVIKNVNFANNPSYTFDGWDLLGNPFVCNASVTLSDGGVAMAYYRVEEAVPGEGGKNVVKASTDPIVPMEGIFVKATATSQTVTFSRIPVAKSPSNLHIEMAEVVTDRNAYGDYDNAIVRFDEGNSLEKFVFNANSSKIYFPQEGKHYAVVNAEDEGELQLNFKAEKNGSFTLRFSTENIEFGYLHLIDKLTGIDTDLLATPSYGFEGSTTDFANRFTLVFKTGTAAEAEAFAYLSNGNIVVVNAEAGTTLQVVDMMGRVVVNSDAQRQVSTANIPAGVYVLRLVSGNSVKTQKIVVE